MRAEFAKDDNGTIWFVYAHKIQARRIVDRSIAIVEQSKKKKTLN